MWYSVINSIIHQRWSGKYYCLLPKYLYLTCTWLKKYLMYLRSSKYSEYLNLYLQIWKSTCTWLKYLTPTLMYIVTIFNPFGMIQGSDQFMNWIGIDNQFNSAWIELELNWKILNWNWIGIESLNWSELINSINSTPHFTRSNIFCIYHIMEIVVWRAIPCKQAYPHAPLCVPSMGSAGVFGHKEITITSIDRSRYYYSHLVAARGRGSGKPHVRVVWTNMTKECEVKCKYHWDIFQNKYENLMMLHIWILCGEDLFSTGIYRLIQTKIYFTVCISMYMMYVKSSVPACTWLILQRPLTATRWL